MSELLSQDSSVFQGRPGIQVSDIKAMANKLKINITGSKTDQERIGEVIVLERVVRYPALCPVLSVRQLLNKIPSHSGSLFIHYDGSKLTRYQFHALLTKAAKISWMEFERIHITFIQDRCCNHCNNEWCAQRSADVNGQMEV